MGGHKQLLGGHSPPGPPVATALGKEPLLLSFRGLIDANTQEHKQIENVHPKDTGQSTKRFSHWPTIAGIQPMCN